MAKGMNTRAETTPQVKHGGMDPRAAAKKTLRHIEVSEAENEGHVAEHHFEHYEHPPETHVFAHGGEKHPVHEGHIFHHLAKHLNIPHEVVHAEGGDGGKEEAKSLGDTREDEEDEA